MAFPDGSDASEVLYDGTRLDPSADGCYPLPGLGRDLVVSPNSHGKYRPAVKPPLIFKTAKNYKGPGQQVRKVTDGCFIVIAPDDWKWTGAPPPIEPAFTVIEGYTAHFVHCTADSDDIGGFDNKSLPRLAGSLLKGRTVDDDDDASGPLFVGPYPELRNGNDFLWAVVGEEGEPPGWRERFNPSTRKLSDVLAERDRGSGPHRGWMFVRLYDATSSLEASSCFRYFPADLKISVDDEPYTRNPRLPGADGHSQALLTFTATPSRVRSGHDLDGDTVLVPDHRDDEVSVVLSTDTHSVRVLISLPRVWWRLAGQEHETDASWQAKPLRLTRQRFEELALSGALLQLSAPHTSQVKCGFDDSDRQAFRSTKAGTIDIPLDSFIDDAALDEGDRPQASLSVSAKDWPRDLSVVRIMGSRADDADATLDHADAAPDNADPDPRLSATSEIAVERNTKQVDSGDYLVRHETQVVSWDEARRTGFVSVPKPGERRAPGTGSRIWVRIDRGYVGVGKVVGREERAQHHILQVRWLDTRSEREALPSQALADPTDALSVPLSGSEGNRAGLWFMYTVGWLKMHFAWNTKGGHDA